MWARFVRYVVFPDKVYKQRPVAERQGPLPLKHAVRGKVYCEGCMWLVKATSGHSCHHESNKIFTKNKKSEWLSPALDHSLKEHPKQKNRRNDCTNKEISQV